MQIVFSRKCGKFGFFESPSLGSAIDVRGRFRGVHNLVVLFLKGIFTMSLKRFRVKRSVVVVLLIATSIVLSGASICGAQWGYRGSRTSPSRSAFRYQGPILSLEVASPYPRSYRAAALPVAPYTSRYPSSYDLSRYGVGIGATTYDRYRGMEPTRAELDRERFYYELDRTHRFQTREERYSNDFAAAYTSPSAMVNRYRYPYVAGAVATPIRPEPVPGTVLGRYQSRYEGYIADDDVAVALRAAAVRLQLSLARKADGHIWIRHLKPDQIIDAIDRAEHPAILSDLIINYEGVSENPRLILIAAANGLEDVRRLLRQYITLSSPYPSAGAVGVDEWQTTSPSDQETILTERVISERVVEPQMEEIQQPTLAPPLPAEPVSSGGFESLDRPRLGNLTDEADIELLPAPVATPIE